MSLRIAPLSETEHAEWDALVAASSHGTVFHHSWWLQATGWPFSLLGCRDSQGALVGGIPLPEKRRLGMRLWHMPPLTPFLGPVFADLHERRERRLSWLRAAASALAAAIRGFDSFEQWVGAAGPDLQGFLWAGFSAELGYTFRFPAGMQPSAILEAMDKRFRTTLHASTEAHITRSERIDVLIHLQAERSRRNSLPYVWSEQLHRDLWSAAHARGQATLYVAEGAQGEPLETLMVVSDARATYQLTGAPSAARVRGVKSALEWQAVQEALAAGRAYDFEGSHLPAVESHYRHFGAQPFPVWKLDRAGSRRGALARLWVRRRRWSASF